MSLTASVADVSVEVCLDPAEIAACKAPQDLRAFGNECANARREHLQRSKVRVISTGINSDPDLERIRWIDIEAPNDRVLSSIGRKLGISDGTLALCMREATVPQTFGRADALYLSFPELSADPKNPNSVKVSTVHAIIGQDYMITIHAKPSCSVSWVEAELKEGKMHPPDHKHSSHLLARLVGSSLHSNSDFISSLEARREQMIGYGATGTPRSETVREITKLEAGLHLAQATLSHVGPIISVLGEKENLFGAEQPKGALGRYHGMVDSMLQSIELSRAAIRSSRENWELESEEKANRSSFRLAFLGGLLGPATAYAGILQTAAAFGAQIPVSTYWQGLAGVAVFSVVLTTLLVKDYFNRSLHKG